MGGERMTVMLVFLCCSGQSVLGRNGTMDDWIRLTNTLFSNYTKAMYPVHNLSEALMIDTSMMLLSITDFDELAGVITINVVLISRWTDFRLTWDPKDYGGIEDIFINGSNLWKPSLFVQSTAQDLEPIGSDQFHVRVNFTGKCLELPGRLVRSSCAVDMRSFPLDSHVCDVIIRQWGVYDDEIKLTYTENRINLSVFSPNGEWNLDETLVSY
ncbi:acetylcholine receptor subunit alpha-1-A-like [Pecten maximus]|uniref:acetylcholine receptor subunit alpha-1-A-like n=1 Tax=Pecten maximus TaxID=6579 RepID=UPI0014587787|nr:acetylcholine receptor subunit alpha-1-A-like [Pecten maximus]